MPKKILLADDSVTIQKVISITFANEGYELIIVGDGNSAISKAREAKPDLVMADVSMPGKSGYEVCEAIKKDPALRHVPVLLLAGTFEPINKEEASRVGADGHIVKPFESQDIIDKVRNLLAKAPAPRPAEKAAPQPQPPRPEAGKPLEVPEGTWGEGDFLGFSEEFEEKPAETSLSADFGFLEEGELGGEEFGAPKEAVPETEFIDLEFKEEELKPFKEAPAKPAPFEEVMSEIEFAEIEPEKKEKGPFKEEEPFKMPSFEEAFDVEAFKGEPFKEPPAEEVTFGEEPFWKTLETTERAEPRGKETKPAPQEGPTPFGREEKTFDRDFLEAPAPPFSFTGEEEKKEEVWPAPPELPKPSEPLRLVRKEERAPFQKGVEEVAAKAVEKVTEKAIPELKAGAEAPQLPRERVEEIVQKVAREVIEEIAWEVVPELAEQLINKELTKIKEAFSKIK